MRPGQPARPWLGLLVGALCTIAIACGGAKRAMAPSGASEMTTSAVPPPAAAAEIDALLRAIDEDLAAMGLARPAAPTAACVQPPCAAGALSAGVLPAHATDPSCKPGGGEVCRDSCQLSDSICDNSGRICRIAMDLGGDDAYANEKCASGKASCEAARAKCCGCQ